MVKYVMLLFFGLAMTLHAQSSYALSLNGTTQYITVPYNSKLDIPNNGALTIEGWIYPTSTTGNILTRAGYGYGLMLVSGKILYWDQGSQVSAKLSTGSVVANKWQHIAVTVKDNGSNLSVNFYINGVPDAGNPQTSTQAQINNGSASATLDFGMQARGTCSCNLYTGYLDEFRFWNIERTAAEIKANYLQSVSTSSTGLYAYYKFDSGSGTSLVDATANGLNGTLLNSPTWVASGANIATAHPGNALKLDGANDYINVPNASQLDFGTSVNFTVECWVKSNGTQTTFPGIVVKAGSGAYWNGFQLAVYGNKFVAEIMNGSTAVGPTQGLQSTTNINDGNWHHLALVVTRSTTNAKMYVDGTQEVNVTNSVIGGNLNAAVNMFIGAERTLAYFYNGWIDEVRVWNTARTQAELQANKNIVIDPRTNGLVAYYRLDQGISGGTNTGVASALDLTSYSNSGTLTNMALSGATSNWVLSTSSVLPVELSTFQAKINGKTVRLNWKTTTEVNNYGFSVERKIGSAEWEAIGFVNGHGNSNKQHEYQFVDVNSEMGRRHYRLKQIDMDGSATFSEIIELDITRPSAVDLAQNHPNPFNPETSIEYQIPATAHVTLKVYDAIGNEVAELVNGTKEPGKYMQVFNARSLASGIYYYQLRVGAATITKKLVVLK